MKPLLLAFLGTSLQGYGSVSRIHELAAIAKHDLLLQPHPQIKDLVELVQKARMSKVTAGLATLQGAMTVKLNNLAAMEINAVRPFFLGALDMFHKYQQVTTQSQGIV